MKFLEKLSLAIFSVIVLMLALVICLLIFGWLKASTVLFVIQLALSKPVVVNILLWSSIVLVLLAIKCIFFFSGDQTEKNEGILLQNENGKLLISVDTIENLVKGVVSGFSNVKTSTCKVSLDRQVNNVKIQLNLTVKADTIIKELSANIQERIKSVVKQTIELDIKEVDIKIKDIEASNNVQAE